MSETDDYRGCGCPDCLVTPHWAHCAVHNEPAFPDGPCDCGAAEGRGPVIPGREAWLARRAAAEAPRKDVSASR